MSDAEIRDELLTLLVAGHETTATALAWAVERLVRHPDKLERLRDEVGRRRRLPDRTIKETLRLRPVISLVIAQADRAGRARRLRAARRRRRPQHLPRPPPPRVYPDPDASSPSASSTTRRHLHLDPLRRRRPPLPRRRLRPVRDAVGPARALARLELRAADARRERSPAGRSSSCPGAAARRRSRGGPPRRRAYGRARPHDGRGGRGRRSADRLAQSQPTLEPPGDPRQVRPRHRPPVARCHRR